MFKLAYRPVAGSILNQAPVLKNGKQKATTIIFKTMKDFRLLFFSLPGYAVFTCQTQLSFDGKAFITYAF